MPDDSLPPDSPFPGVFRLPQENWPGPQGDPVPAPEPLVPYASVVLPGPGFWGAVGWLLLLGLLQAILLGSLFGPLRFTALESRAALLLTANGFPLLGITAVLMMKLFGF